MKAAIAFRVDPQGTVQPCTFCGAPGHWSEAGLRGMYAPPNGHTLRPDGTQDCPRARTEPAEDA